jgi:hypothetical protein
MGEADKSRISIRGLTSEDCLCACDRRGIGTSTITCLGKYHSEGRQLSIPPLTHIFEVWYSRGELLSANSTSAGDGQDDFLFYWPCQACLVGGLRVSRKVGFTGVGGVLGLG